MAPLVTVLDSMGVPTTHLLQRAGIPKDLLGDGEALVPSHLLHRFVEIAGRWADVGNLGVMVGQRTSAYELGVFGQILKRSATVFEYLQTGSRLIGSVTSGERFWLTREGTQVRFHHFQPGHPGAGRCHSDLYALVVTLNMLRSFLGPEWKPQEVRLLATNADLVGDGAVFGDVDVRLNQSHTSFTMPLSTLGQAIPAALRGPVLGTWPAFEVRPDMPASFVESVESLIASLLMSDALNIDVVAEAAGTSTRTLQRLLQAQGLSYSAVVQQTRLRIATDWLTSTVTPIAEIALMLGYRDPAHFSRAFRSKSGVSPRKYRSQHR